MRSLAAWLGVVVLASYSQATAQTPAPGPLPGHSVHGEAFNEGPRQRAYLMGGTGDIRFSITTKSTDAQAFFNQGVGQLHGFWYFESERSFRQALSLDPDCAMAYWGLALANQNNPARAKPFIEKANEKKGQVTPREAMWIDAWYAYYTAGGDEKGKRRQLIRAIENIIQTHPDDVEAKAFLIVQIWLNNAHDLPISSHQAVDALLDQLFALAPMHPAHHYRIHLWDGEKTPRALRSASLCGTAAPGIAHLWHMPGHTYSGEQRYDDAAWQQEASNRVDHAYMIRDRILPDQIHNYAHNSEWLARDLIYMGRSQQALIVAKNMVTIPRHPKYNMIGGGGTAQYGRSRLFDVLTRFELWDELVALTETRYIEPTDNFDEQVKRMRWLGAARAARGEVDAANAQITALDALLVAEKAAQDAAGAEAETKARSENKPENEITQARDNARNAKKPRIDMLEAALAHIRGQIALAQNQKDEAFAQLDKAGLERDVMALARLKVGDLENAEKLAREAYNGGRHQVLPLAALVEVLHAAGKIDEAKRFLDELRILAARADLNSPRLARLLPVAKALGLPDDWRSPPMVRPDFGYRPAIESLGPLEWRPSVAPAWSRPGIDGTIVGTEQLRGRPVVLLFYLGFGCVHCVEQLKTFGPLTQQFADAGLSIVAVSTDPLAALQQSAATLPDGTKLPFPIVSDESLDAFRAFRAHDDFEGKPLHATVLIDGEGLIRWQDIGYQPFGDANFLLNEARRLLAFPKNAAVQ